MRSRQSWGHGDLGDLADLATWSGSDLGADFMLINPLHAAEPLPPVSASPYLPMSRRFTSPLYLRVEDIPEYATLTAGDRVRIDSLAAPLRARNASSELLDRDEVWRAKRSALEIIYRQPLTAAPAGRVRRVPCQRGAAAGRLGALVRAGRTARARTGAAGRGRCATPGRPGWRRNGPGWLARPGFTHGCSGWPTRSWPARSRRRAQPG